MQAMAKTVHGRIRLLLIVNFGLMNLGAGLADFALGFRVRDVPRP